MSLTEVCMSLMMIALGMLYWLFRRTEALLQEERKNRAVEQMLRTLSAFVKGRQSTTTKSDRSNSDSNVGVVCIDLENFLKVFKIRLLPALNRYEWAGVKRQVTEVHVAKPERTGIHPRLDQIIRSCNTAGYYRVDYETAQVDLEGVSTKSDWIISMATRPEACHSHSHLVSALEGKLEDNSLGAAQQGEGYVGARMQDQLEMNGRLDAGTRIYGYAFGSDGVYVTISLLQIVDVNTRPEFQVYRSNRILLWPAHEPPREETVGMRLLRTMLSLPPDALGYHVNSQIFRCGALRLTAEEVLGRGSFCTAFLASAPNGVRAVVKKAIFTSIDRVQRKDQLTHLTNEQNILRSFRGTQILPRLLDDRVVATTDAPYLVIVPAGTVLPLFAATLSLVQRRQLAPKLHVDLLSCLAAAHALGFCHSDLRPDNIIALPGNTFTVIDWGLGRTSNSPMHHYRGGLCYMHDDVLARMPIVDGCEVILYKPEYDVAAVKYIAWAFANSEKKLKVPWADCSPQEMVKLRRALVA